MGNKNISKNPRITIFWFDPNMSKSYNKKVIKKISCLIDEIRQLYQDIKLECTLETFYNKNQMHLIKICENTNDLSFHLIITSGILKHEAFHLFEMNNKVTGFIVFCYKKENHYDSNRFSNKVISVVDKSRDLLAVMKDFLVNEIESKIKALLKTNEENFEWVELKDFYNKSRSSFLKVCPSESQNNCLKYIYYDLIEEGKDKLLEIKRSIFDEGKAIKLNICSAKKLSEFNEHELDQINYLYELVVTLKLDYLPQDNFDMFKTKVLEIFLFSNIFSDSFNHNRLKELKSINNLKSFKKEIFSLFMNRKWMIALNRFFLDLNVSSLLDLTKLKYVLSCLILNFNNPRKVLTDEYLLIIKDKDKNIELEEDEIISSSNFLVFEKFSLSSELNDSIIFKFEIEEEKSHNKYTFNYIFYENDYIVVAPFSQFKIIKITKNPSFTLVQIKIIPNNLIISLPFCGVFMENTNDYDESYINCLEEKEKFLFEKIEVFQSLFHLRNKEYNLNFSLNVLFIYETLGVLSRNRKIYWQSIDNFSKALEIAEGSFGNESLISTNISFQIGKVYMLLEEKEEALNKFNLCLSNYKKFFGEECLIIAFTYFNLGKIYTNLMDNEQALKCFNISQNLFEKILGDYHFMNLKSLNDIAVILFQLGSKSKSLEVYEKVLNKMKYMEVEEVKSFYPVVYSNIASVYEEKKELSKALDFYEKSLTYDCHSKYFNKNKKCSILITIANIYIHLQQYEKAIKFLHESLEIKINLNGENHPEVCFSYNNLAYLYNKLKEYKQALFFFRKAEEVAIYNFHEISVFTSKIWNNMGVVAFLLHDYDYAIQCLSKSLETKIKLFGDNNIEVVYVLYHLSLAQDKVGNFDSSLILLKRAILTERKIQENITKNQPMKRNSIYQKCEKVYLNN